MDGSDQWHAMYKTKLVLKQIASTQTDFVPQHKLFLCGYAVLKLYRTVCYIINCAQDRNGIIHFTRDLQNILYWSVVSHVPRIVCICYSTVNIGKCN
jgi:hypothetical protein